MIGIREPKKIVMEDGTVFKFMSRIPFYDYNRMKNAFKRTGVRHRFTKVFDNRDTVVAYDVYVA